MTFSIAARCARTGMLGGAVTTSSIATGSRCPYGRSNVGFAFAQNYADPRLSRRAIALLEEGHDAEAALARVVEAAAHREHRQLTLVDKEGRTAHFTGKRGIPTHAAATATDCVAAGNILANDRVPAAMVAEFGARPEAHLAQRLVDALSAGLKAGGETGPVRAANVMVYDRHEWPIVDLRVDWHPDPIAELQSMWLVYEPELPAFVLRALDPEKALYEAH